MNKKKRRKWIRYEREHSLSAGHMDWYESENGKRICAIEDDSSRKILVCGEFDAHTEENSIIMFNNLVSEYWWIRPIA